MQCPIGFVLVLLSLFSGRIKLWSEKYADQAFHQTFDSDATASQKTIEERPVSKALNINYYPT